MQEATGWKGCSYPLKIRYVALAAIEEVSRRSAWGAVSYPEEQTAKDGGSTYIGGSWNL
jgi:hypothetical protein